MGSSSLGVGWPHLIRGGSVMEGERAADGGRGLGGKGEAVVNLGSLTARANFVNWLGFSGPRAEYI